MSHFLAILCVLVSFATISTAQTATDDVRYMLERGDINSLEKQIAALHVEAQEHQNGAVLREVYQRLFNTTHPERLAVIDRWQEEMPLSIYALAAQTWGAIKMVEMGASRDYETPGSPRDRLLSYMAASRRAHALVDRSLSRSPNFVPTLDAWMVSRKFYRKRQKSTPINSVVYDAVMKASPDRTSLLKIIDTVDTSFANPTHEILEACLRYAPLARDYDSDLCTTEAFLRHYVDKDIRKQAKVTLDARDDPFLDDLKLDKILYTRGFFDHEHTDEFRTLMIALHANSLKSQDQIGDYVTFGYRIASFLDDPSYIDVSNARLFRFIDDYLRDDPYNHNLIQVKIEALSTAYQRFNRIEDLEMARTLWPTAMEYGRYESRLWQLGVTLASADREPYDIEDQIVLMENAIAYARPGFGQTIGALDWMVSARDDALEKLEHETLGDFSPDPAKVAAMLDCPILRAARVVSALCQTRSVPSDYCAPDQPIYKKLTDVLENRVAGSCPIVSKTRLSDLEYLATPFGSIALPWDRGTSN